MRNVTFIFQQQMQGLHVAVRLNNSFPEIYLLQCSAQVFKRAGCHLKRAHLAR